MKIILKLIFLFFLISSCKNRSILLNYDYIEKIKKTLDYNYYSVVYTNEIKEEAISSITFYNSDNKIIQHLYGESNTRFIYNTKGRLIEKRHCRFRNCDNKNTELIIYDKKGNHIGKYLKKDSITDIDSLKIIKTKFYDSKNRIIREYFGLRSKEKESWKHYSYNNNNLSESIEILGSDTLWNVKYIYNANNQLIKIQKNKDTIFKNEVFDYDLNGRKILLIKHSNEKSVFDDLSVYSEPLITTFEYDKKNRLKKQIVNQRKQKTILLYVYEK